MIQTTNFCATCGKPLPAGFSLCRVCSIPQWYKDALNIKLSRPWLLQPREEVKASLVRICETRDPTEWTELQVRQFIELQMGLMWPTDRYKAYYVAEYEDFECGPTDVSTEVAEQFINVKPVDLLHCGLLILSSVVLSYPWVDVRQKIEELASVLYYLATGSVIVAQKKVVVFPFGSALNEKVQVLRESIDDSTLLMDAVKLLFEQWHIPHQASGEYGMYSTEEPIGEEE